MNHNKMGKYLPHRFCVATFITLTALISWPAIAGLGAGAEDAPTRVVMADAKPPGQINPAAQLRAGNMAYSREEYTKALRIFRNIAVLGVPEAHYRLGVMYAEGLGTRKNSRQAEYWLNLAARKHYPGAAQALESLRDAENTPHREPARSPSPSSRGIL